MPEISFHAGSIFLTPPEKKLSKGVEDPGEKYMEAAWQVLTAIRDDLANRAGLPNVEDVAHHLKELLPATAEVEAALHLAQGLTKKLEENLG